VVLKLVLVKNHKEPLEEYKNDVKYNNAMISSRQESKF